MPFPVPDFKIQQADFASHNVKIETIILDDEKKIPVVSSNYLGIIKVFNPTNHDGAFIYNGKITNVAKNSAYIYLISNDNKIVNMNLV